MWKSHILYRTHTKPQLEALCQYSCLSSLLKCELVNVLAQKSGESPPKQSSTSKKYEGDLNYRHPSFNNTLLEISAFYHQLPILGSKEQLVLRICLVRHNRVADVVAREERQLRDLIDISQVVILNLRSLNFSSHIYRKRECTITGNNPYMDFGGKKGSPLYLSHPYPWLHAFLYYHPYFLEQLIVLYLYTIQ